MSIYSEELIDAVRSLVKSKAEARKIAIAVYHQAQVAGWQNELNFPK
jgi:hypothetical protein